MNKKGAMGGTLFVIISMVIVILLLVVIVPSVMNQFKGLNGYLRGIDTTNKFCDQIADELTQKDVALVADGQQYTGQTVPKPAICEELAQENGMHRTGRKTTGIKEFKWTFSKESSPEYDNEYCCLFIVKEGSEEEKARIEKEEKQKEAAAEEGEVSPTTSPITTPTEPEAQNTDPIIPSITRLSEAKGFMTCKTSANRLAISFSNEAENGDSQIGDLRWMATENGGRVLTLLKINEVAKSQIKTYLNGHIDRWNEFKTECK